VYGWIERSSVMRDRSEQVQAPYLQLSVCALANATSVPINSIEFKVMLRPAASSMLHLTSQNADFSLENVPSAFGSTPHPISITVRPRAEAMEAFRRVADSVFRGERVELRVEWRSPAFNVLPLPPLPDSTGLTWSTNERWS